MFAIIENLFSRDSFRNHVTLGRFSTLKAYLVRIKIDCKHIQSFLDFGLQAYLVPFETEIAPM